MRKSPCAEGLEPYDPKFIAASTLLSANENPADAPARVRGAALDRLARTPFNRYPDPACTELRGLIAENIYRLVLPTLPDTSWDELGNPAIDASSVVVGNGGDELLANLFLAFGGPGNTVLLSPPSFSVYDIDARLTYTDVANVPRRPDFTIDEKAILEQAGRDDINIVVLTSPNNPTGDCVRPEFVEELLDATNALVVVDEAYGEFAARTCIPLVDKYDNLCVLRTFSKAYALAGVRLGYVVASRPVAGMLLAVRQPYSVDVLAQAVGAEVCHNVEAFRPGILEILRNREDLIRKLSAICGLEVFPTCSNFAMVRMKGADTVWRAMVEEDGVLVRNLCSQKGLENCLRITVGTTEENEAVLASLAANIVKGF